MKDYKGLNIYGSTDPFDDFFYSTHNSNGEPLDAIDDELDKENLMQTTKDTEIEFDLPEVEKKEVTAPKVSVIGGTCVSCEG